MNKIRHFFYLLKKRARPDGQGLTEYAIILVLVAVVAIFAVNLLGGAVRNSFNTFIGQGRFAPPDVGPIGGNFTPRPPTPTPINQPPTITNFSSNPPSPHQVAPGGTANVTFNVTATDDVQVAQFDIDYDGDGLASPDYTWTPGGTPPSSSYGTGVHIITVRATDNQGSSTEQELTLVIYDDPSQIPDVPPVIVSVMATPLQGNHPLTVTFSSVATADFDSTIVAYRWSFGTGFVDSSSGANPTFTYTQPGTYEVVLQVEDNEGLKTSSDPFLIVVAESTPTPGPTASNTPACSVGPFSVPSQVVQFEDFNCGGQNVGYSDTDPLNQGGQHRPTEGVDIETTTDTSGAFNITSVQNGEWLRYDVEVASSGFYDMDVRLSSNDSSGSLRVLMDGADITGLLNIPNTGGSWTDLSINSLVLVGGSRTLEFQLTGANYKLNYFSLADSIGTATFTPTPSPTPTNTPTSTPTPTFTPTPQPITVTFYSNDGQDGHVINRNNNNVSTNGVIQVGDTNGTTTRIGMVSFDTSTIPATAIIDSVQLRMRRQNETRDPTTLGTLQVDIGPAAGFNNNLALERDDFNAIAAGYVVATLPYPNSNGDWTTGNLNGLGQSLVNRNGTTQLRIYFLIPNDLDGNADFLRFNDGGSGNPPELIVTYHLP